MRRLVLPAAVVLGLLTVFVIARVTQPGPARVAVQGGQNAAVGSVTRSCPPSAAGTAAGRITMIALPPRTADGAQASARAAAATPAGDATFRAVVAAPAASGVKTSGKAAPTTNSRTPTIKIARSAGVCCRGGDAFMVATLMACDVTS